MNTASLRKLAPTLGYSMNVAGSVLLGAGPMQREAAGDMISDKNDRDSGRKND
jgi:hypothetical protein